MTLKFDSNKTVIHADLDRNEAIVFGKFLIAERYRHKEDIRKIDNTILELEYKHDIRISDTIQ